MSDLVTAPVWVRLLADAAEAGGSRKARKCDDRKDGVVERKVVPLANTKKLMCSLENVT